MEIFIYFLVLVGVLSFVGFILWDKMEEESRININSFKIFEREIKRTLENNITVLAMRLEAELNIGLKEWSEKHDHQNIKIADLERVVRTVVYDVLCDKKGANMQQESDVSVNNADKLK